MQAERYKAELEQRDVEFKTLEDEHSVLKLEATLAQEQLQAKRQELDDLLSRWVKEKQVRHAAFACLRPVAHRTAAISTGGRGSDE